MEKMSSSISSGYLLCPHCGHHGPKDDYNYSEELLYNKINKKEVEAAAMILGIPLHRITDVRKCDKVDVWECPKCKAKISQD